jgi:uncharacterized protein YerC
MDEQKKKFMRYVAKDSDRKVGELSECWLWDGSKHRDGYGWFQTNYAKETGCRYAHQMSYHLFKDSTYRPSRETPLRHLCESSEVGAHRSCVNPDHLTVGTIQQNMADRDANLGSYQLKGEDVGTAKFSLEQCRVIQQKHLEGREYKDIAVELGVNRRTIERICTGQTYGLPDCRIILAQKKVERDKKVLELIAAGHSYSEIKRQTGLSPGFISSLKSKQPKPAEAT